MGALAFTAKEFYFEKIYLAVMMGFLILWVILYNIENKICDMDGRKRTYPSFFHYMFLKKDWSSYCNILSWSIFVGVLFRAIITAIYGVAA